MKKPDPIGTLFIHFRKADVEDYPELKKKCEDRDEGTELNALSIDFSVRVNNDDLRFTEKDLFPDDPEQFLKQGMVMAIMEQLVSGLARARGISFDEATEKAVEKVEAAERAVSLGNLVGKALLACQKAEGEC